MKLPCRTRRRRIAVTAVVLAWLPYVVFRCVSVPGSAHTACYAMGQHDDAAERKIDEKSHEQAGHHHRGPASSCCELTGRSNVNLPVPFVPDPPLLTALAVLPPDPAAPTTEALDAPGSLSRAHAPPLYLGNSALRL